jgi:glycosyltransferase involved in cell wall biosynthesis
MGDYSGKFIYDLISNLRHYGIETTVLAPIFRDERYDKTAVHEKMGQIEIWRFFYFYPMKYQKLNREGGIVYNFNVSNLAKIQVPLFLISQMIFAFILIKTKKIQMVHSHWIIPQGFVGSLIQKFTKKPHIVTIHAADVFALKKLPFHKNILKFIISNTDHIFSVSEYVWHCLYEITPVESRGRLEERKLILPMGGYPFPLITVAEKQNLRTKYKLNNSFILLFIGRLHEKKGIIYLIHAMGILINKLDNVKLVICGGGPLSDKLKRAVTDLQLNDNVFFKGFISETDKIELLAISDLLVVPSIIMESGETEGLPAVIQEGLSAGKPIIASNVSGANEIIINGENGILIEEKSAEDLAEAIILLKNNEDLRKKIERNALESSKKFEWAIISERYFEIIRKYIDFEEIH